MAVASARPYASHLHFAPRPGSPNPSGGAYMECFPMILCSEVVRRWLTPVLRGEMRKGKRGERSDGKDAGKREETEYQCILLIYRHP